MFSLINGTRRQDTLVQFLCKIPKLHSILTEITFQKSDKYRSNKSVNEISEYISRPNLSRNKIHFHYSQKDVKQFNNSEKLYAMGKFINFWRNSFDPWNEFLIRERNFLINFAFIVFIMWKIVFFSEFLTC